MASASKGKGAVKTVEWWKHLRDRKRAQNRKVREDGKKQIIEEIDPKERQRIHSKNRRPQNGDFSEYQVRCMVASYCRDITVGMTGWGVPFTDWVELKGLAKFEKGSLYKLDKPACECEMCDGRRAAHEELEKCVHNE
jgi:hypothetical protein